MSEIISVRCSLITCTIIVLLTAGAIAGIDRFGSNSRVYGQTGTIQAKFISKHMVDDPTQAYRIWRESGYRGRTVIFVSDRWESFNPGELIPEQMFRAYPLQLYIPARLIEENHLDGKTFMYVASLHKICRKIVAIVPESEVSRMKEIARTVKHSRVSDTGVYLSRQGFPRWFTTGANFAGAGEPALLYIGASYFSSAEPEDLYRFLSASGLKTDCVILCKEKGKATVTQKEISRLNKFARLMGMSPSSVDGVDMTTSRGLILPQIVLAS